MVKFLIDVNLPKKIIFWSGQEYLHVFDLNDQWSDEKIWNYAKKRNLTIVTKDADFSDRIISSIPPPKVIHFRTGNLKMDAFHEFVGKHWPEIIILNKSHKLINIYNERLIAIS